MRAIGALLLCLCAGCGQVRIERPGRIVGIDPCSLLTARDVAEVLPGAPAKPTTKVVYEEAWDCWWVNDRGEMVRAALDFETRSLDHYYRVYGGQGELKKRPGLGRLSRLVGSHELHAMSSDDVLWFVGACLRGKTGANVDAVLTRLGKKVSARIEAGFPGKAGVPSPRGTQPKSCDFPHGAH